eukprot:508645-Amphidinium_carterae.1
MASLYLCDVKVKGLISVNGNNLMKRVSSDYWSEHITATHIFHYEAMYSVRVLEEIGSPSMEVLASLLHGEFGSTVSATMQQHAPMLYARILALRETLKQTGTTTCEEITETLYNANGTTKKVKVTL